MSSLRCDIEENRLVLKLQPAICLNTSFVFMNYQSSNVSCNMLLMFNWSLSGIMTSNLIIHACSLSNSDFTKFLGHYPIQIQKSPNLKMIIFPNLIFASNGTTRVNISIISTIDIFFNSPI